MIWLDFDYVFICVDVGFSWTIHNHCFRDGSGIDGNSKSQKASTVFDKGPAKLSHMMATMLSLIFHLHLLHAWGTFSICTIGDIGLMENF